MDERRLVARLVGLTITTAQARRTFPGIPASVFYGIAPPSDRGRLLTFGAAFKAARHHAQEEACEARQALAAAAHAADLAERQAAVAPVALAYVSGVVEREVETLAASLRARAASPRAIQTLELIAGRCARQIGRAHVRIAGKGGRHAVEA